MPKQPKGQCNVSIAWMDNVDRRLNLILAAISQLQTHGQISPELEEQVNKAAALSASIDWKVPDE